MFILRSKLPYYYHHKFVYIILSFKSIPLIFWDPVLSSLISACMNNTFIFTLYFLTPNLLIKPEGCDLQYSSTLSGVSENSDNFSKLELHSNYCVVYHGLIEFV